jgi:hypothetical protein
MPGYCSDIKTLYPLGFFGGMIRTLLKLFDVKAPLKGHFKMPPPMPPFFVAGQFASRFGRGLSHIVSCRII